MAISALDNAAVFLSDFAVTATINGRAIKGILDKEPVDVSMMDTLQITFTCKTTDLSTVSRLDTLKDIDNEVDYTIVKIPPDDGTGYTIIELETQ